MVGNLRVVASTSHENHHFEVARIDEPSAGPKNTRSASRSVMS
jgi:hypothetical protein